MTHNLKVAVFGSSRPPAGTKRYEEARLLGYSLATAGYTVVSGGYRGIMEAASRGAKEAGGSTIGVTTAFFDSKNIKPNKYVDTEIKTPTYADRLLKLTEISDAYVIMRGGSGTLTELFFSWELEKNKSIPPRPIILFGDQWKRIIDFLANELPDELSFSSYIHLLAYADKPEEVVDIIKKGHKAMGLI
ncbi:MAG: LOG family protein [Candidatus Latescibacteria bacterium]|nr:LOG family protein [Candidatus Latescibacterota bacterium]